MRTSYPFFATLLFLISQVDCFSNRGNTLYDLEFNTASFYDEVAAWKVYSNITADPVSYCNGQPILGGDGKIGANTTFSRTYTNIPSTYKIAWYVINFWIFGPIDATQGLSINITGSNVTQSSFKMDYDTTKWTANACGTGKYGLISAQVYVGTYKVGNTVRLDIKNLKDWGGSIPQFGIRDISVYYSSWPQNLLSYCAPLGTTYSPLTPQCNFYLDGSYLQSGVKKPCSTSQCNTCIGAAANCYSCKYKQFYNSQYCYNCDASCDTCNGTASTNCQSCPSGKYLYKNQTCIGSCPAPYQIVTKTEITYCNFPCPSSTYYYVNGSCLSTCSSPFTIQYSGADAMCNFACSAGSYLYPNNTCKATCNSPFQSVNIGGYLYCQYPCQPTTNYKYFNSSCMGSCVSPFISFTDSNNIKLCQNPCEGNPSSFVYWNSSCLTTCAAPLIQQIRSDVRLCIYPCSVGQYLYLNGSCINSCNSPMVIRNNPGSAYCDFPCPAGSQYVYPNGTCQSSCQAPFFPRNEPNANFCQFPCGVGQYYFKNGSCLGACSIPRIQRNDYGKTFCDFPCSSGQQYLYSNGSCSSACDPPFVIRNQSDGFYCEAPCAGGLHYYNNGSCISTCDSPRLPRTVAGYNFCDFPCSSSQQYLYSNGSCSSVCDSPFVVRDQLDGFDCEAPCTGGLYYYNNGSCISSCNSPRTSRTVAGSNFCDFPCSQSEFLFENSCTNDCLFPLLTQNELDGMTCYYPCNVGDYLYGNGSCLSSCDSPMAIRTEGSNEYCDFPCLASEYYYLNGSCLTSCQLNFNVRNEPNIGKFCDYPCNNDTQYLLENGTCWNSCNSSLNEIQIRDGYKYCILSENTSCSSNNYHTEDGCVNSCEYPRIQQKKNNVTFCKSPCSDSKLFYFPGDKSCRESCATPFTASKMDIYQSCGPKGVVAALESSRNSLVGVASYGLLASNLISLGSSSGITLGVLAKMLQYIKYLKIGYSESLAELLLLWKNNYVSLQVFPSFAEEKEEESVPFNFAKWDITSSFISNFSTELASFGVVFLLLFGIKVAERFIKNKAKMRYARIVVHNLVFMLLYSNLGDILFYSMLGFRYAKVYSFETVLNLLISITCFGGGLFALIFHLHLLFKYEKQRNEGKFLIEKRDLDNGELMKKYGSFAILFKELKEEKFSQQSFLFFFAARDILCSLLLTTLFEQTQIQSILIFLLNLLMMGYILISRPYKPKLEFIQEVFCELVLLSVNMSMLVMAILESTGTLTPNTRDNMSAVIILTNYTFNVAILIFICAKLYIEIKEIIHARRMKKKVVPIRPCLTNKSSVSSADRENVPKFGPRDRVRFRLPSPDGSMSNLIRSTNLEFDSDSPESKIVVHSMSPQSQQTDSKILFDSKSSESLLLEKLPNGSLISRDLEARGKKRQFTWRKKIPLA